DPLHDERVRLQERAPGVQPALVDQLAHGRKHSTRFHAGGPLRVTIQSIVPPYGTRFRGEAMRSQPTLAERLAQQACAFYQDRKRLPATLSARAAAHLLDYLGNALGGSVVPSSDTLRAAFSHVPAGSATVIGGAGVALPEYAALLNGAFAHALEMDDTHQPSSTHPGAVVIPAALAAAEQIDASGRELLAAIVAGYEVMARLGMALGPAAQYARG